MTKKIMLMSYGKELFLLNKLAEHYISDYSSQKTHLINVNMEIDIFDALYTRFMKIENMILSNGATEKKANSFLSGYKSLNRLYKKGL